MLNELLNDKNINRVYTLCRRFDPSNERQRLIDAFQKFSIESNVDLSGSDRIRIVEGDITAGYGDSAHNSDSPHVELQSAKGLLNPE
jgi:thioester reductase-like protein